MNIDRIRYFNIIAETGSLVGAAEVLHISQPALSKALKTLEGEVGMKLMEAEGRGLRLTEAGQRLRQQSSVLLEEWMSLPNKIRNHQSQKPTRIVSFEVFSTYFLGYLTDSVDIEGLDFLELGPGKMERAVAEGLADLGITYVPVPHAGVDFVEVTKIRMGVFGLDLFSSTNFSALPFVIPIMPADGTPSKVIGIDGWPEHHHKRLVKYRVTMMESALELCRRGRAVAYLPTFVARLHNQNVLPELRLSEISAPVKLKDRSQSVYLISPRGTSETKLHRQIARCLRQVK